MNDGSIHTTIDEELKKGNTVIYFTVGVSMQPLLTERKTHVKIAPVERVRSGDILLYIRKSGAHVLHRCIKQNADYCYMRGDNTYGLEKIKKEQVIGMVTFVYRNDKWIDVKSSKTYKGYVFIWRFLYPFRWFAWKTKIVLRRICKWVVNRSI